MRVVFGQNVLDIELRQLERNGEVIHLSPKALTMLEVLVSERPRPVSKKTLLDRVWPDAVVEEQNVKNTIVEIRAALGDSASAVRTVNRFGYAFTAPAEEHVDGRQAARFWLAYELRALALGNGTSDIGRDPSCTIYIDAPGISRHHARIAASGESVMLEDLGSKNGTWVEGHRISEPTFLRNGDRIRVGAATLVFRTRSSIQSTTTGPKSVDLSE